MSSADNHVNNVLGPAVVTRARGGEYTRMLVFFEIERDRVLGTGFTSGSNVFPDCFYGTCDGFQAKTRACKHLYHPTKKMSSGVAKHPSRPTSSSIGKATYMQMYVRSTPARSANLSVGQKDLS